MATLELYSTQKMKMEWWVLQKNLCQTLENLKRDLLLNLGGRNTELVLVLKFYGYQWWARPLGHLADPTASRNFSSVTSRSTFAQLVVASWSLFEWSRGHCAAATVRLRMFSLLVKPSNFCCYCCCRALKLAGGCLAPVFVVPCWLQVCNSKNW